MGSDVFVYFTLEGASVQSQELVELAHDSGRTDTGADRDHVVARLDPTTSITEGNTAELWADRPLDLRLRPRLRSEPHAWNDADERSCISAITDRGLRVPLRSRVGGAGRPRRLDRLAHLPALRLGRCFSAILGDRRTDGGCSRRRVPRGRSRAAIAKAHSFSKPSTGPTMARLRSSIACHPRDRHGEVIRLVEGRRGRVAMQMELIIRFDYGQIVPWVRNVDGTLAAIGGPDALRLVTPIEVTGRDMTSGAEFFVSEGDVVALRLVWHPAHVEYEPAGDPRPHRCIGGTVVEGVVGAGHVQRTLG